MVSTGEIEQSGTRHTSRARHAVRCAIALVVGAFSVLGVLTLTTVTDTFSGGPQAAATGTAQVRECTELGPVSYAGLGTYYRCAADVTWDDGRNSREWFPAGQLRPDDHGTAVPVFTPELPDTSRRGGPLATEPGRNDNATWVSVGLIGATVLGLVAVLALFRAVFEAYGAMRPGHGSAGGRGSRRSRANSDWPITDADEAVVPRFRREVRTTWLSIAVCLGIVLHLIASIPYNDAPRAVDFVSPWSEITTAWLLGPGEPSIVVDFGVVLVGAGIAALIAGMGGGIRGSSAELARYGISRLMTERKWSRKQANKELRQMADGRQSAYRRGVAFALVVLGLAAYATVHAITALPGDAPPLVMIAGLRDAIVLAVIGVVLLVTVEPMYDRVSRLLAIHDENFADTSGTDRNPAQS